jgi:anti-sigma regulatory factor (Ser/Thr protein kinase)
MTGTGAEPASGTYALLHDPRATSKFERTYPGEAAQVRQVRDDIARAFGWCPVADDLVLVASEFAANAILHTQSGNGGKFTVTAGVLIGDYAWIDVEDQGGQPPPRAPGDPREPLDPDAAAPVAGGADREAGRGLQIVANLAGGDGNWGLDPLARTRPGDGRLSPQQEKPEHVAWARIPWPPIPRGPLTTVIAPMARAAGMDVLEMTRRPGEVFALAITNPRVPALGRILIDCTGFLEWDRLADMGEEDAGAVRTADVILAILAGQHPPPPGPGRGWC